MSQLAEIEKLYAKEQEKKIGNAILKLKPMSLEDMSSLDMKTDASASEVAMQAIKMFSVTLGCTEEEAKKISFEHLKELMDALMEINNFTDDDMQKTGLKEFMADKKKKLEEQKKE